MGGVRGSSTFTLALRGSPHSDLADGKLSTRERIDPQELGRSVVRDPPAREERPGTFGSSSRRNDTRRPETATGVISGNGGKRTWSSDQDRSLSETVPSGAVTEEQRGPERVEIRRSSLGAFAFLDGTTRRRPGS